LVGACATAGPAAAAIRHAAAAAAIDLSALRRDSVERVVIVVLLLVTVRVSRVCGTVARVRKASRVPCVPALADAAAIRPANVTRLLGQGKPTPRVRRARGACTTRATPLFG
jgi:hypothetical protein